MEYDKKKFKGYPVNEVQRIVCWVATVPFPFTHCEFCPYINKCKINEIERQEKIKSGAYLKGRGKKIFKSTKKKMEKEERKKMKIEKVK